MTAGSELHELQVLATQLAELQQADILIYSGELTRPGDGNLALGHRGRSKRPNCLLVLRSLGGSADAAYRLARALQRHYIRVLVYADDYCKGAGVLLALAADELVMSDFGELGPLDLVSQHAIVPGHNESGRALVQGIQALRAEAESSFEQNVVRFRSRRSVAMSVRSAIEQASALSIGLMAPVFAQIDPLQVAEVDRAMKTATLYVHRLGAHHLKEGGLERLLTGYPSHDFVIDREEATELLRTVRAPTTEEGVFLTHIEPVLAAKRLQGRLLFIDEALTLVGAPVRARGAESHEQHSADPENASTVAAPLADTRTDAKP
jgi:hypothetical protein